MVTSRFSLKTLFFGVTGFALFFAVVSQAIRGQGWALAMAFALAALLCILFFHVILFTISVLLHGTWRVLWPKRPGAGESSPFAQHRLPPQWIEPSEPEG